jgi:hypothetical protein
MKVRVYDGSMHAVDSKPSLSNFVLRKVSKLLLLSVNSSMTFSHYTEAPQGIAKEIMEKAKGEA